MQLSGQCYFDVKKGKPFSVDFGEGSLEVLGTSFDVKVRDDIFLVKCFTRKISVKNIMNQSCVLTRGQQVKSINGELNKTTFISTSPNWMKGCYVYENELLSSVLNDMVAEYNLVISGKSYDKRFTGKLQKDNLEKAVKVLFGSLGIEYSLTHKELKIE